MSQTATVPAARAGGAGTLHKWWTLAIVCVAIFMLLLDITVVNVALPQIERALSASFTQLQWVIDAYALALAVLVLNAGSLSDILGRKRIFIVGLVLFSLASLACGLSPSAEFLIGARAVQGIGGAIMFATSLALINHAFPPQERGTAFGIWGATTGAAVAIGPLIGGVLTTGIDWRWIFFVNVPIGALAVVFSLLRLDESRDPRTRPIDWPGLVTLSGSMFLLVYALLRGNAVGWTSGLIVGEFVGAVVLLAAFLALEWRRRDRAMLDLSLFRLPAFTGAQLVAFFLSASAFSLFLYLTLYMQNILGYSALGAGLRLLPTSLLAFVMAPISGRLSAKVPVRLLMGLGVALVGVAMLLMRAVTPTSPWTTLLPGLVFLGAGMGLTNPALASTAIGVAPRRLAGMASGTNNTFRQVGIATGIAALGALFVSRVQSSLASALAGTPGAAHAHDLSGAVSSGAVRQVLRIVPPEARGQFLKAARAAFVEGMDHVFAAAAVVAALGVIAAFVLVRGRDLHLERTPGEVAAAG